MSVIRLNIIVEGQTEEAFVKNVLAEHLWQHNIYATPKLVRTGNMNTRAHKGGLSDYEKLKRELQRWIKQDQGAWFTTMMDLYAYPKNAPGYAFRQSSEPYARVTGLEQDLVTDIDSPRFIPYLQLHEFETLLFSDLSKWTRALPENGEDIEALAKSIANFTDVELINDGSETAPSKRILAHVPRYDKVAFGASIATEIGLNVIRSNCRHFNCWLTKLENLGT
ncbi:MAG: DUF4276 family protein [Candidatus Hydrogenedentes bacterium]|nr:DUF4276 family protein [Candidatus Hydrogenedentota bacterium]